MYFYHEDYPSFYGTALHDLGLQDRRDEMPIEKPIRIPAILGWLVVMSVALCLIVTALQVLS